MQQHPAHLINCLLTNIGMPSETAVNVDRDGEFVNTARSVMTLLYRAKECAPTTPDSSARYEVRMRTIRLRKTGAKNVVGNGTVQQECNNRQRGDNETVVGLASVENGQEVSE